MDEIWRDIDTTGTGNDIPLQFRPHVPLNLYLPEVTRRPNFHGNSRRLDEISADLDIDGVRFKSRILNSESLSTRNLKTLCLVDS
jgi:hypothetical protein